MCLPNYKDLRNYTLWAREIVRYLTAIVPVLEHSGSIPSTTGHLRTICNSIYRVSDTHFCSPRAPDTAW